MIPDIGARKAGIPMKKWAWILVCSWAVSTAASGALATDGWGHLKGKIKVIGEVPEPQPENVPVRVECETPEPRRP